MKLPILIICFFCLSLTEFSSATNIDCYYKRDDWDFVGRHYQCSIKDDPIIVEAQNAVVTSVSGEHLNGKNSDDVGVFRAYNKTIHYFPKELEKFFKNLIGISISLCHLKEIHQSDLKPFPELVFLSIYSNDLEVIDSGLFDFNLKLGYLNLEKNKITKIHSNVFDNLEILVSLNLKSNLCVDKHGYNYPGRSEIKKLITSQCKSPSRHAAEIAAIKKEIEALKKKLAILEADED